MKRIFALIIALMVLFVGCDAVNLNQDVNSAAEEFTSTEALDFSSADGDTTESGDIHTEEPTTESSTTEGSTTEGSTTEESTTEGSTTEGSTTEESTTEESTIGGSTTGGSTTGGSTTGGSTTGGSTTGGSTTGGSTTGGSTTGGSTTGGSTTGGSTTGGSTTGGSTTGGSTTGGSTTEESTTEESTTEEFTTEESTTEESTTGGSSSGGSSSGDSSSGDSSSSGTYSETLYVNYINVGQGDSILIKVGDCDILIDGGKTGYGSTVSSYLRSQGVDDIELMINSHPDEDHYGGLTQVLGDFVVEKFWGSAYSKTTSTFKTFKSAVSSEGLSWTTPSVGTVYTYEYLTLTVLYSAVGSDSNNSSIVVMLEYGSFRFLFTGDAGSEVETKLVSSGADLSCDVLKVGHHGSKYSSTASFLSATGAEYGVICVGSNSYGHPTSEALGRLSAAGVSVYRTDLNGNVVFSTDGATLYLPGGSTDSSGSGSGVVSGGSSSGGSSSGGSSSGSTTTEYFIGNTETKVFHLPTCSNLPAASKQNEMYNYDWIVNIAGYTPCGRCLANYSGGSSSTVTYIANSSSKVYHLPTCSYLPTTNRVTITNTTGYTPCSRCIGSTSTKTYIANTETKVYHLSTCSYLPAASKQKVITSTSGYTACGHCIK